MKLSDIQLTNINEGRRCISFSAFDGQKSIVCEVSFEAMDHAEQAQSTLIDERLDQFERLQPQIVEAVARPFVIDGEHLELGASVGLARALPGERAYEFMSRADQALYASKRAGGRCVSVWPADGLNAAA